MDANSEKGYGLDVRCSAEGQSAHTSIADQKRMIEQFAAEIGVSVVGSYVDQGHSGLNMERSALIKERVAVGYVRSSVEGDGGHSSVGAQKRMIERFAAEIGVSVMDWYVDQGHNGLDMERPALQQLLAAAQSGHGSFGLVVVWEPSRLSRNPDDAAAIASLLRESGVKLVFVS